MRSRRTAGAPGLWAGCALALLLCAPRPAAAQINSVTYEITDTAIVYHVSVLASGHVDVYHNRATAPGAGETGDQRVTVTGFGVDITWNNAPNGVYSSWVQFRVNPADAAEVGDVRGPINIIIGPELEYCSMAVSVSCQPTPPGVVATAINGSTVRYTARVCNLGSRGAGPFRVGVWYNHNGPPLPGEREDQFASVDGLDPFWKKPQCRTDGFWGWWNWWNLCSDQGTPGDSSDDCCPEVTITSSTLPNGVYSSWVKIDSGDFQTEVCKNNNVYGPIPINLAYPDIVVTRFEASVNGQTVIYSVDFCNRGAATASTFYVDVYFDRKLPPDPGYPGDLITQVDSLEVNACRHLEFVRGTTGYGTYNSWVLADADNFLTEPDKLNNRKGPLEVVVGHQQGCVDADGDGYGVGDACTGPQDCNDADPSVHPGAEEICGDGIDNNCNQTIDDGCPGVNCTDGDGDGWPVGPDCVVQDCDDTDPTVYPGAPEVCGDDKDNNCEGIVDDGCPGRMCDDEDGDGYGVGPGCPGPQDTDDHDPDVHPGATEICGDGKDNNCNGIVDDGCTGCTDTDGDGYGVGDGCGPLVDRDCDDSDPSVHPGAEEPCDGRDNNCNGSTDEGCPGVDCVDQDGDGWPVGPDCGPVQDCNDDDPTIYPGAPEVCGDGKDNNCNGSVDDGCPGVDCVDSDGDGWPSGTGCVTEDGQPAPQDCSPTDESVSPWAAEICADGIDNDCNGQTDEGCPTCEDKDHDGFFVGPECPLNVKQDCDDTNAAIYPGAPETCQGHKDTNCDGVIAPAEDCGKRSGCDCGGGAGSLGDGGVGGGMDRILVVGLLAFGFACPRRSRRR
jgi:hypothetical protein